MNGLLLLSNVYRRIGILKKTLQDDLALLQKTYLQKEKKAKAMAETLQATVLHLQAENLKAVDNFNELKIKHDENVKKLVAETAQLQDLLETARNEVNRLRDRSEGQAKRLMEIPRLEEAYLRAARGLVKQSEATLMMKEIGWRRLKEEVKSLTFWKLKAQSLEDSLLQQNGVVEELTAQNRLHFARYQALLVANAARDRRGIRRAPESAQPVAEPLPLTSSKPLSPSKPTHQHRHKDLQEELLQLRAITEHKDATIRRLSRQLARARGSPLLSATSPSSSSFFSLEEKNTKTHSGRPRDIFRELDAESGSSSDDEDGDSKTSRNDRLEEAARLQKQFMERIQTRRAESAPHIQAIRQARSFGS